MDIYEDWDPGHYVPPKKLKLYEEVEEENDFYDVYPEEE